MTSYHFWGFISSSLFLSSIPAIFHQLKTITQRKRLIANGSLSETATQSISLNQIFSSYLAVFSFFIFGLVRDTPDLFLTIPRAIMGFLLYLVILELYRDRRDVRSLTALLAASLSLITPGVIFLSGLRASSFTRSGADTLVCLATVLLAQGNLSQYLALKRSQKRGAVSLPMHLVLYLKDLSGLLFGLELGAAAWSIVAMHGSNLVLRAPVIWGYLRISRERGS